MELLSEKDQAVLGKLRELGGEASPHRIGASLYGSAGRPDAKVRGTLQRLERLGFVKRSSWFESVETWILVEGKK
jgi:DNA-binding IclR family transcriptional regulator